MLIQVEPIVFGCSANRVAGSTLVRLGCVHVIQSTEKRELDKNLRKGPASDGQLSKVKYFSCLLPFILCRTLTADGKSVDPRFRIQQVPEMRIPSTVEEETEGREGMTLDTQTTQTRMPASQAARMWHSFHVRSRGNNLLIKPQVNPPLQLFPRGQLYRAQSRCLLPLYVCEWVCVGVGVCVSLLVRYVFVRVCICECVPFYLLFFFCARACVFLIRCVCVCVFWGGGVMP
jgi:hypothetical protein